MLRGKGLTDWEWVYKTFPKWMLQEIDSQETIKEKNGAGKNDHGGHIQASGYRMTDDYRAEVRRQIGESESSRERVTDRTKARLRAARHKNNTL